jgi:hypothetical protein
MASSRQRAIISHGSDQPGPTLLHGSFFPTDPNTGVAWTASGLNAATSGMKIAS